MYLYLEKCKTFHFKYSKKTPSQITKTQPQPF